MHHFRRGQEICLLMMTPMNWIEESFEVRRQLHHQHLREVPSVWANPLLGEVTQLEMVAWDTMVMAMVDIEMAGLVIHLTAVIGMAYHHLRPKKSVGQRGLDIEMIAQTIDYHQDHLLPRHPEITQIMMVGEAIVQTDTDLVHET